MTGVIHKPLNRITYFVPLNVRLMLYNALILPHLNYCVTAWGYQCNRIIKLQKKAIRTVMISSYNAHTESFFKNLKLLKIQDILTLQTLKIYHKFRNNKLPYYIQNWPLFQNSNIHNHNTRGANALHKNRCLHVFAQKSLNPGEPKTCFIFRKKLNCVYNGYYRLTKHKKVKKNFFWLKTFSVPMLIYTVTDSNAQWVAYDPWIGGPAKVSKSAYWNTKVSVDILYDLVNWYNKN